MTGLLVHGSNGAAVDAKEDQVCVPLRDALLAFKVRCADPVREARHQELHPGSLELLVRGARHAVQECLRSVSKGRLDLLQWLQSRLRLARAALQLQPLLY